MGSLQAFALEVALVAAATFSALLLRDNFETSPDHIAALIPYLFASLCVSSAVFLAAGTHRGLWRFASVSDGVAISAAAAATALGAMALGFSYNRLEGVPRSLPLLQGLLIVAYLGGARLAARVGDVRGMRRAPAQPDVAAPSRRKTVLVVGLGRLADLYLRCVAELAAERVHVAGILGLSDRHVGRLARGVPILGLTEAASSVIYALETHGVIVDAVVVAADFDRFSPAAQAALLALETDGRIKLEFLAEQIGLALRAGDEETAAAPDEPVVEPAFARGETELERVAGRSVWRLKRLLDVSIAGTLLLLCAPVMLCVAIGVAADVGAPVTFWQLRPGLNGRAFKLYKFRTMRAAHDPLGRRIAEDNRLSQFGVFLRRSRLDELPQLVNILRGEMSFVGPRPLLAVDQPADCVARLLVRPGLTGWAQVKGGRQLSVNDKTALDLWYLRNATLALDGAVLLLTAQMLFFGERIDQRAVDAAWRELRATARADDV